MERDIKIDFLRFVGLAMVIFAHVNPPDFLFQIRDFDVPLMVLVSAWSFGLTYRGEQSYGGYLWKRVKRLIFPVWIFLSIYFVAEYFIYPASLELNFNTILSSYALVSGIGYVWIIRVFILVAVVSPFIFILNRKVKSNVWYLLGCLFGLLVYELLKFQYPSLDNNLIDKFVLNVVYYIIPFAAVFAIGLRMLNMDHRQVFFVGFVAFVVYLTCQYFFYLYGISPQFTFNYKYPPSLFYLSYSIFVSSFLWVMADRLCKGHFYFKSNSVLGFISSNSIWIYLWHIPLVKVIHYDYWIKYFLVFSIAAIVCCVQIYLVDVFIRKFIVNQRLARNIKIIFTG